MENIRKPTSQYRVTNKIFYTVPWLMFHERHCPRQSRETWSSEISTCFQFGKLLARGVETRRGKEYISVRVELPAEVSGLWWIRNRYGVGVHRFVSVLIGHFVTVIRCVLLPCNKIPAIHLVLHTGPAGCNRRETLATPVVILIFHRTNRADFCRTTDWNETIEMLLIMSCPTTQ